MPIQEKDLGKYTKPGIYIEENDNSIVDTPVQNVLINLVPGFSKKGPFNNPIYIDNSTAFKQTFGEIDYQLERKGSYFHRTCLKMLETGPIWALNLLKTTPEIDKLNYVSISASAKYASSDLSNPTEADYGSFFNRQDFWVRDTESFLDLVNNPTEDLERLVHLTNMGDKTISVFLFKSTTTNFDVTAEVWYDGATKVPSYIHPKSLISDFLVDVLIIAGNWTDYKTLSVDPKWSKYFTINGLIITKISDFVNESGVDVLANYDTSLIPNFKDLNNRNMYIEDVINNDTNKTSLFCTYNKDLLMDSDYLTDLIDMIGFTIVGTNTDSINFLSYNEQIKETKSYETVSLDTLGNVFAKSITGFDSYEDTTHINWSTNGLIAGTFTSGSTMSDFSFGSGSYIINGVEYTLTDGDVAFATLAVGKERTDIIYLDADGIQVETGTLSNLGTQTLKNINFINENTIILGIIRLTNTTGTYDGTYSGITVDETGFITVPVTISAQSDHLLYTFTTGTVTIRNNEYAKLRALKYYNEISLNTTYKSVITLSDGSGKSQVASITATPYSSSAQSTIKFYLNDEVNIAITDYSLYTTGAIFYIDNEINISNTSTLQTSYLTTTNNVAKYSDFYQDFISGEINNGDYVSGTTIDNEIEMYVDVNGILNVTFNDSVDSSFDVVTDLGNWRQTLEIDSVGDITDETNTLSIKVNKNRYTEIKKGYYIEAYYDEDALEVGETPRKLTRIINVKNDTVNTDLKILYTDAPISIKHIVGVTGTTELYTTVYPSIDKYATHLKGAALVPFKLNASSIPNNTETRLNDILDVMGLGTQMFKGLVNKNKISWRYLVDSFGLGLQESSKQQYIDLCGKKLNCLGFINMPSVKQLKNSSNPSYINDDGSFSTAYLKDGANTDKNPDLLYSFGTGVGRSCTGYFFPYVKQTVDGISKEVPPAAFIASAYMRKQLSNASGTYPWTIVAGIGDGRVPDISGTEMDFTDDDLINLASMGANPITFVRNVGYIINDENSAQVFPLSSLSYIHSREVLIELENELYDMLLRYQWKFNTTSIRSEIKYKADKICNSYVEAGGLYAFKNTIDSTNNTNYIIDLQGGALDTSVEIVKGMGWIVNNITIEKTGTINSTGFQQA